MNVKKISPVCKYMQTQKYEPRSKRHVSRKSPQSVDNRTPSPCEYKTEYAIDEQRFTLEW